MTSTILKSTLVVIFLTLLGSVLGFIRESYVAFAYGATGATDAYLVAAVIPDIVAGWISYSITNALIPLLGSELRKSKTSSLKLISVVFWDSFIVLLVFTGMVSNFKDGLILLIAPTFSTNEHAVATHLLAIMLLSILFSGLSGVVWGVHNAYGDFIYPSLISVVSNVIILAFVIVFHKTLGLSSLAYGVVAGSIGRLLVQLIPLTFKHGVGWLKTSIWHPSLPIIAKSFVVIFMNVGVGSLSTVVDRILASFLSVGQVSALNYAGKIGALPQSVLGNSLATTLYPRFVSSHLEGDQNRSSRMLSDAFGLVIFWGIVIGVNFVLWAQQIIGFLYQRGEFTHHDVIATSRPFMIFGFFISIYLLSPVLTHFFYAWGKNRFILKVSFISICMNISGSLVLYKSLGIEGLVLANALALMFYVIYLYLTACNMLGLQPLRFVAKSIREGGPPGIVLILGTIVTWGETQMFHPSFVNSLLYPAVGLVIGIISIYVYSIAVPRNLVSNLIVKFVSKYHVKH